MSAQPAGAAVATAALPERDSSTLIAFGIITALLIPFIGFILGLVLIARDETKWGIRIIVGSVGAFLFWMNYWV